MLIARELEIELKRSVFSKSYFEFFKWSFNVLYPQEKYEDAFHIEYLCNLYQKEIERIVHKEEKDKDIIVNIPPRSSKSLITSVCLNAWAWIKDPTMAVITVSFDEELTLVNARLCKDLIKSDAYQELFGHIYQIRSDADRMGFFMTDKGGFRMSKTTGANITGHKGIIIIVDDPLNPKTAESEVSRASTIDYYTRSLYNRLTPANLGIRIIIMQRLHENDLTGYLLSTNPNAYTHICLPAEIGKNEKVPDNILPIELKEKYKDGLLDSIRLGPKVLADFKKVLGTRGYSGQYDQRPAPEAGNILKKEWFDTVMPATLTRDVTNSPIMFFVDPAYTKDTTNDPTAIFTCFKQENFIYVLDVTEQWLEFPDLIKFIKSYTARFQLSSDSKVFIEPKASGKSIAQQLRTETSLNVVEIESTDKDKVTRVNAISPVIEGRRVRLVAGTYIAHFLEQCGNFPNATHDDMVDVLTYAVDTLLVSNSPDWFFA